MSVTSYPTPLNSTSTDIELVGGKDAFIGMQREDKDGNRYVLHKVSSDAGTILDATFVGGYMAYDGVDYPFQASHAVIGANTTGKTLTPGQYFWCMVYGTYTMTVGADVTSSYMRLMNSGGWGIKIGSDGIGPRESCGMSLEAYSARVTAKARCLIDPRSGA
jgi:hypothetical protein